MRLWAHVCHHLQWGCPSPRFGLALWRTSCINIKKGVYGLKLACTKILKAVANGCKIWPTSTQPKRSNVKVMNFKIKTLTDKANWLACYLNPSISSSPMSFHCLDLDKIGMSDLVHCTVIVICAYRPQSLWILHNFNRPFYWNMPFVFMHAYRPYWLASAVEMCTKQTHNRVTPALAAYKTGWYSLI